MFGRAERLDALIHGAAGEAQFSDAVVCDAGVIALRDRICATADARVRKLEAHVNIRLHNGTVLEKHVEHALVTVERPMSDRDLEEKFRSLTDGILGAAQSDRVIELCWRIAELDDAGELGDAPPSRRIRLIDHHDAPPFVCSGDTRCP